MVTKCLRNMQWVYNRPSKGMMQEGDLVFGQSYLKKLKSGQVLVKNLLLSLDPTNRVWMNPEDNYLPALIEGQVMRGIAIGKVVESRNDQFAEGQLVQGMLGWQEYYVSNGDDISILPQFADFPLEAYFGLLGHIGITAHYGLLEVAKPKAGQTVVVSAAAGAVGSLVCQIAKLIGCKVIGICGTDKKCEWLRGLNIDYTINYKSENLKLKLKEMCPEGVDIYFDNTGGYILDMVLQYMKDFGTIVACGMIAQYNNSAITMKNLINLVIKRIKLQGFVCLDHMEYAQIAYPELVTWYKLGKIKFRVDVIDGLENALESVKKLFTGKNQGKLLVKIADPVLSTNIEYNSIHMR